MARWIIDYTYCIEDERVVVAFSREEAKDVAEEAGRSMFGPTFEVIGVRPEDPDHIG